MIENQVINAILQNKDFQFIQLNDITEEYFPTYKEEFKFIQEHFNKYKVVCDTQTFIAKFPEFKLIDVSEPESYLVDKIREECVYNETVPVIQQAAKLLTDGDARDAVGFLVSKISTLNTRTAFEAVDLVREADLRFQNYVDRTLNRDKYFITTGFKELDDIIGGWDAKEELVVVAARTNQGKSWWLIYFLLHAAKQGKKVGLYSGEMSEGKVGYRADSFFSHISNYAITKGNASVKEEYQRSIEEFKKLEGNFYVVTPKMLGGPATVSKLRAFCERYKLDMLGVDQYSLLRDAHNSKVRYERYENLSMDMKFMQNELQIPVIVASQLGRGATAKDKEDAGTEDMGGADRITQDATMILTIKQKEPNVELRILKGRDCQVGSKLTYNWNIDRGEFVYVPTQDDAPTQLKGKNGCEQVRQKYESTDNGEPF